MTTNGRRPITRGRAWLASAAVGAIGAPFLLWFIAYVWGPGTEATPEMTSVPIVILLSMPVGLLAGTFATGIRGLVALWLGALCATLVIAAQYYSPGLGGLAATLAVLVIPQAVLPGYVLARVVDGATPGRRRSVQARIVTLWLVPSIAAYSLVGLTGALNAATLRSSREASCASLASTMALSGRIAFVGSHALCVADLGHRSVRMVYGSPTDVDETLLSPRWSPDGTTIAAIREQRPIRGSITKEIVLIVAEGGAVTKLDQPAHVGSVHSLDWAPDGKRLIVAADDQGCGACARLYIAPVDGGAWTLSPSDPTVRDVAYPAWSPVNDQILVNAATEGSEALYGSAGLLIIDPSGRRLASVATDAYYLSSASWSLDGSRIAFGRKMDRGVDVYLARANGTVRTRLAATPESPVIDAATTGPVWSPDGQALAVSIYASNELPHAISIVAIGGGAAKQLIGDATSFDWAP